MAGIYLHIPFCKQACTYCNFHFTTSLRYKDDLVQALLKEIRLERDYLEGAAVETIYFGGGTPSLLSLADCEAILQEIKSCFPVSGDAEITLEAHPDDITPDHLKGWKQAGINRLSMGVQSFFEEELRWMNRAHHAGQARQSIEWSFREGFTNMTIDLIYGSPLLTDEGWKENVDIATGYGIPHLSCYALTVEEKTPLHKHISRKESQEVDNEKQARQFLQLMEWLSAKGYEHYEVSNFALPGKRSRHNSAYWKGIPYLGFGPSAHSYNGIQRRWNVANNTLYIKGLSENKPKRETEILSAQDRLNETIMISLRTREGLNLDHLASQWGTETRDRIGLQLQKYIQHRLIQVTGSQVQLTNEGMLRADGIAADLFI
ncbi:MAG TPA: radical SAM family heme chaperone HemW [Flavisolibacter sp.]|nr:radical SAM family heme chaperone HemW [Flavisolibacter sp.]